MIDLKAKRAEFQATLNAKKEAERPLTFAECHADPEKAWRVLSVLSNPGTKNKETGEVSKAAEMAKKMFPAFGIGTSTRKRNGEYVERTNIKNIRTMYAIRGKIEAMAVAETEDSYFGYYESIFEYLNSYAVNVVQDMSNADEEFFNKIFEIEQLAKQEMAENLKTARVAAAKKILENAGEEI